MLKALRKNTKTIIWVVVTLFCLWGGFEFGVSMQQTSKQNAGKVFGQAIPFTEYNLFFRAAEIFSFTGSPLTDPDQLNAQAWQNIIYSAEAKREKIDVSTQEIRDEITRLLKDQKIENPNQDFYERWLQASFGLTPPQFESIIREMIRIQKLVKKIADAPVVEMSEAEMKQKFEREHASLSLEIMNFTKEEEASAFAEKIKKNPDDWADLTKNQAQKTGITSLENLTQLWNIGSESLETLQALEMGSVSGSFARGPQFSVAKIVEKKAPTESDFTEEIKKKYAEDFGKQQKYQRFITWNEDLQKRAALQDLIPKSPKPKNPEESAGTATPSEPAIAASSETTETPETNPSQAAAELTKE